jgi:hypothetical protein
MTWITKLLETDLPPINWDPNGIGGTSYAHDIKYFGFVVSMRPSQYLKLAVPMDHDRTNPHVQQTLAQGGAVAPAFLIVDFAGDQPHPVVVGHEGRNRLRAIKQMYGDIPVPVHIVPYRERARHMTTDKIEGFKAAALSEKYHMYTSNNFIELISWDDRNLET